MNETAATVENQPENKVRSYLDSSIKKDKVTTPEEASDMHSFLLGARFFESNSPVARQVFEISEKVRIGKRDLEGIARFGDPENPAVDYSLVSEAAKNGVAPKGIQYQAHRVLGALGNEDSQIRMQKMYLDAFTNDESFKAQHSQYAKKRYEEELTSTTKKLEHDLSTTITDPTSGDTKTVAEIIDVYTHLDNNTNTAQLFGKYLAKNSTS